ncbi:TPA: TIR domain-containing protein [Vibrio cholerae]|nr:NACHT domain-containing protein [Vibrio cholerae]GHY48711.1 hypothetical protein VCSRO24_0531 [Vibrio cholerae]
MQKKIFISYSWEDILHDKWVERLAHSLEQYPDIHVIWDKYDLSSAGDKNFFMEKAIFSTDFMLVIATETYVKKANERKGGVGIETFMSVSRHWEQLLDEEKQNTHAIVILKDKGQIPNYLKGHCYVDFTDNNKFEQNLEELLKEINKSRNVLRPQKISQPSTSRKKTYRLTKAEELIAISTPSRKVLIPESEGTDFSLNQRIKYEVWENNNVFPSIIVILHPNINMKQTLVAVSKKINEKAIPTERLLVLSETAKRESLLQYLKKENPAKYSNVNATEITYQEYIWNYCIDNEFKEIDKPIEIDFYTEQELKDSSGNVFSAIDKLVESLETRSDYISHLLVGSGGMGKSSLCLSLINRLADNNKNIPLLISSEEIRKYCEDYNYNPHVATNIFDLYEIQAKCNQHLNILDRKKFELALLSGSLTIIIDGLDEFPSIFGEKFDTRKFLESISNIHSELGNSRILITSRENNLLSDSEIENLNINKFELLGFQEKDCKRYVRKRFKDIYGLDELTEISESIVNKVKDTSFYEEGRIVPFFIDVTCNIYEESDSSSLIDFSHNQEIPYKCLNSVTDGIIFSIFDREKVRHSIPISSYDMFDIFCYFSATLGKRWDVEQIKQYISMLYGEENKYDSILNSILINPLLLKNKEHLELKYDFTLSYFNTIFMIEHLTKESVLTEFIYLIAKTNYKSTSFFDLKQYLNTNKVNVLELVKSIINKIEQKRSVDDSVYSSEKYISAVEFLFYLSVMCHNNPDKNKVTDNFKYIFGRGMRDSVNKAYLKGDLPPIDFSNLTISESRFTDYQNFLNSDFLGSSFIYTRFDKCFNRNITNKNILESKIDRNSCELGDLQEALNIIDEKNRLDKDNILQECRKFLGSFLKGQSFRDNNEVHIRFSTIVKGLQRTEFKKLIRQGFIVLNADKEVDKFYALSDNFKISARRFVLNGTKDQQIKDFIRFVSC